MKMVWVVVACVAWVSASRPEGAEPVASYASPAAGPETGRDVSPQPVGDLGNPERLVLQGVTAFPSEQVKAALLEDSDVLLAGHPAAPLVEYAQTLHRKLHAGYRRAGFGDVQITVKVDPKAGRVVVTVEEGPRYQAGEVEVQGGRTLPQGKLRERLTRKQDGVQSREPIWAIGQPAPFPVMPWNVTVRESPVVEVATAKAPAGTPPPCSNEQVPSDLHRQVKSALADAGYFLAKFQVRVVPNAGKAPRGPENRMARLVIAIAEEGPRGEVGEIEVAGNNFHSHEAILKCLGLSPGQPLGREECLRLQEKLWRSGRFITSQVVPSWPSSPSDKTVLKIFVKEVDGAPPLDRPLSTEDQVLMKCRDRLSDTSRWEGDLFVRTAGAEGSMTLVISPAKGVLVVGSLKDRPEGKPDYALLASSREIGLYSAPRRRKWVVSALPGRVIATIALRMSQDADKQRNASVFGLGVNSEPVPVELKMELEPSAMLFGLHREDTKYELRDGVLTITFREVRVRIDAASGRLLDILIGDSEAPSGGEDIGIRWTVTFIPGEFDRRAKAIRESTAGFANEYDARRPLSTLLGYVCDQEAFWPLVKLGSRDESTVSVLRLLLHRRVLQGLDDVLLRFLERNGRGWAIPAEAVTAPGSSDAGLSQLAARAMLSISSELFPRRSWPWTLSRETAMNLIGKGRYTLDEFQKLYHAEDIGPFGCLMAATVLEHSSPPLANLFATRGLERISAQGFRKDYRALLDRRYALGNCLARLAEAFRDLDDEDVERLTAAFPGRYEEWFRDCTRILRADRSKSIEQVLPDVLDALWEDELCDEAKQLLERMRDRNQGGRGPR